MFFCKKNFFLILAGRLFRKIISITVKPFNGHRRKYFQHRKVLIMIFLQNKTAYLISTFDVDNTKLCIYGYEQNCSEKIIFL